MEHFFLPKRIWISINHKYKIQDSTWNILPLHRYRRVLSKKFLQESYEDTKFARKPLLEVDIWQMQLYLIYRFLIMKRHFFQTLRLTMTNVYGIAINN